MAEKDFVDFENDFKGFFSMANIDPSVDTIMTVLQKAERSRYRHLILELGDGKFLLFCADPKMAKAVKKALAKFEEVRFGCSCYGS